METNKRLSVELSQEQLDKIMEEVAIFAEKIYSESEKLKETNYNQYMKEMQTFCEDNEKLGDSY